MIKPEEIHSRSEMVPTRKMGASSTGEGDRLFDILFTRGLLVDIADTSGLVGQAQEGDIVPVLDQVLAEVLVLAGHTVVRKRADEEEGDDGAEDSQAATNPEGAGVAPVGVSTTEVCNDGGERCRTRQRGVSDWTRRSCTRRLTPGTNERADLAEGSSHTVEAATHSSGSSLSSQETETVSGTKLAEAEEDPVDDGEGRDMVGELGVKAAHDEPDDGLAK